MTIRLRFSVDLEFDSKETANAYSMAFGFALGEIEQRALELSESPAPAIAHGRPRVEMTDAAGHG